MGVDITVVFQKKEHDRWIDISSNYEGAGDSGLFQWLGYRASSEGYFHLKPLSLPRGIPADFDLVEHDFHPIASSAIRVPGWREISDKVPDDPFYLKIPMGDRDFSWLHADEILGVVPRAMGALPMPIDEFRDWDGISLPHGWGPWALERVSTRVVRPDEITEYTSYVAVEFDYDLTEDFRYFVDEVRRLKALHGEVRLVFGFS